MATTPSKVPGARWESSRHRHGLWRGPKRLAFIGLTDPLRGPRKYRWSLDDEWPRKSHEEDTLRAARRTAEKAILEKEMIPLTLKELSHLFVPHAGLKDDATQVVVIDGKRRIAVNGKKDPLGVVTLRTVPAESLPSLPSPLRPIKPLNPAHCQATRDDGDCDWVDCPQKRDGEPRKTGRHCPLDIWNEDH